MEAAILHSTFYILHSNAEEFFLFFQFHLQDFQETWLQSVPEGMITDLSYLQVGMFLESL